MLAFEHGATMTMTVEHMSRVATTLRLRGFTREGPFSLNVTTTNRIYYEIDWKINKEIEHLLRIHLRDRGGSRRHPSTGDGAASQRRF